MINSQRLCYGDKIRLFTTSAFAESPVEKNGGYIGTYFKSGGIGPLLAVPPIQAPYNALFEPCIFQILNPSDRHQVGQEIKHDDLFVLVQQNGKSLKKLHKTDLIGLKESEKGDELIFTFMGENTNKKSPITFKEKLTLHSVKVNKKTGVRSSIAVTNVRRDGAKVTGGYLCISTEPSVVGLPIIFEPRSIDEGFLATISLMESSGTGQVQFDSDLYTLPGNYHTLSTDGMNSKGLLQSQVTISSFNHDHHLTQAHNLPLNGTLVVDIPDIGKAQIPTFALPPPPVNLAVQCSFAPPTTQEAFEKYYDTESDISYVGQFFEKEFALKGAYDDAKISLRWQRSMVLPPTRLTLDQDKDHIPDIVIESFMRKTPSVGSLPLIVASTIVVFVCNYVLQYNLLIRAFEWDVLPLFRLVAPAVLICLFLLNYVSIAQYRTSLKYDRSAYSNLMAQVKEKTSKSQKQKKTLTEYSWTITPSAPTSKKHQSKIDDVLNVNNYNNIVLTLTTEPSVVQSTHSVSVEPSSLPLPELAPSYSTSHPYSPNPSSPGYPGSPISASLAELSTDQFYTSQLLQAIRSAALVSTGQPCSSGLVQVNEDDLHKISVRQKLLDAIREQGMSPVSLKALLADEMNAVNFTVTSPDPAMKNGNVNVLDYHPLLFSAIRNAHGVSDEDYINEWMYSLDKLPNLGVGAGRSGALFMNSKSNRFIMKSLTKDDVHTLLLMIRDYTEYVCNSPSRLMKFLGLHQLKYKGKVNYIVVAENVFYSPPTIPLSFDEKYDLKGRRPKKVPEKRPSESNHGIWKDNQVSRVFNVHADVRDEVIAVLNKDVEFLQSHDIIDYSLLCGVAENHNGEITIVKDKLMAPGTGYLVPSPSHDEIFTIGIIDFLSRYQTFKKRTAHFMKSFLWTDDELSTVNSAFYGNRFKDYLQVMLPAADAIIITTEDQLREALQIPADQKLSSFLPSEARMAFHKHAKSAGVVITGPRGEKYVIPPRGVIGDSLSMSTTRSVYSPVSP